MMVFNSESELYGSPDVGTLVDHVDYDKQTIVDFLTGAGFRNNDDGQWKLRGDSDPQGWVQTGRSLLVELDSELESGIDVYAVEVATDRDDTIVRTDYAVSLLKELAYYDNEINFE